MSISTISRFAAFILLLIYSPLLSAEVEDQSQITVEDKTPTQVIQQIMQRSEFGYEKEVKRWRFKETEPEDEQNPFDLKLPADVIELIAMAFEVVLWGIPVIILLLLYHYRHLFDTVGLFKKSSTKTVKTFQGLDISTASLPDDVQQSANKLWQEHQYRAALSLLYRGALVYFFEKHSTLLQDGMTEGECMALFDRYEPGLNADYFKSLSGVWIKLAYAHKQPDDEGFNSLCEQWSEVFKDESCN